jgi:hypothetical protein
VQVVPGTPGPVESADDALLFCEQYGLPVIFKAAFYALTQWQSNESMLLTKWQKYESML